ncbi:MAG: hypothetical protein KDM81_10520, partial [Verrucomicrobiae bacterium]|nr:hypothetical protein [Verrucomicrobiae bacterium]
FQLRLPWPVQNVYKFDNRIRNFEKKYEQTTTADAKIIVIQTFIGWKIKNAQVYLERFAGNDQRAEESLEGLLRDAKNSVIGRHPFSDLISPDREKLKFDEIEQQMLTSIQQKAADTYGVDVTMLGIKQIGLPESLSTVVFERMKAERQKLAAAYRADGDQRAQQIRSDADKQKEDILTAAKSQAINIRGGGEAAAAKALKSFEQNPELAVFLLKLDALEAALKNKSTLVLDPSTPPFDLLEAEQKPEAAGH